MEATAAKRKASEGEGDSNALAISAATAAAAAGTALASATATQIRSSKRAKETKRLDEGRNHDRSDGDSVQRLGSKVELLRRDAAYKGGAWVQGFILDARPRSAVVRMANVKDIDADWSKLRPPPPQPPQDWWQGAKTVETWSKCERGTSGIRNGGQWCCRRTPPLPQSPPPRSPPQQPRQQPPLPRPPAQGQSQPPPSLQQTPAPQSSQPPSSQPYLLPLPAPLRPQRSRQQLTGLRKTCCMSAQRPTAARKERGKLSQGSSGRFGGGRRANIRSH